MAEMDPISTVLGRLPPEITATDPDVVARYLTDFRHFRTGAARAVLRPRSTVEVQAIVALCAAHGVPLVPQGGNTSYCAAATPSQDGDELVLSLERLNAVRAIDAANLSLTAEAGCVLSVLQEAADAAGLMLPLDLGSRQSCQLGGALSTNAGGISVLKYGMARDLVLGLEAVLPDGQLLNVLQPLRKNNTGYDVKQMLLGAEGTLGIITNLTLRLAGIPEAISGGVCAFPTIRAACDAVILTIQSGLPVARIELLDEVQVRACNAYSKLDLAEQPTLFVEFHGTEASVHEQSERFSEIAAEYGGGGFRWTTRPEERTRLWQARHDAYWACLPLKPGAKALATDVCVPLSRLADCVDETKRDIEEMGMLAPIVGHVGDGNFHTVTLVDMSDPQDVAKAKDFISRMVKRSLAMGGTATGEHGVGQGKRGYMEAEHGGATLDAMRAIKQALDPQNIMNPGKILP